MITFNMTVSNMNFEMADGNNLHLKLYEKRSSTFELSEHIDTMICISKGYYDDFYKEYEKKNNDFKGFSPSFNIEDI